jgi:DNA (cytosine-5)-methyltransferase 1
LFSGIGGLDLAAEWAGFETVLQVEIDDYATKVLEKHWPAVKRIRDIRDVNRDTVNGPVTVVSGGFPCQPFSAAGKRGGREDDRYLWPEMLRVIREFSPTWVVGENVAGLFSINEGLEIESIISQLEDEGYEVITALYPAAGVGAPHKRDRIFIVANRNSLRMEGQRAEQQTARSCGEGEAMADAETTVRRWADGTNNAGRRDTKIRRCGKPIRRTEHWDVEPDVGRVAHGISSRMDRLKCLGNAVVPQQAAPIFRAIAEAEYGRATYTEAG